MTAGTGLVSLPNGLWVAVVSDDAADHAAKCLNVAQFSERMCFLGTAKFPKEASCAH